VHGINVELLNRFVPPQSQAMEEAIRELLSKIDLLVVWGTVLPSKLPRRPTQNAFKFSKKLCRVSHVWRRSAPKATRISVM
jgi:hypothetical protein